MTIMDLLVVISAVHQGQDYYCLLNVERQTATGRAFIGSSEIFPVSPTRSPWSSKFKHVKVCRRYLFHVTFP